MVVRCPSGQVVRCPSGQIVRCPLGQVVRCPSGQIVRCPDFSDCKLHKTQLPCLRYRVSYRIFGVGGGGGGGGGVGGRSLWDTAIASCT